MYEHIFCVPTHRVIDDTALNRHFLEVAHAQRRWRMRLPLVVADDGESNKEALSTAGARFPDVECYYFTHDDVKSLYDAISRQLPAAACKPFARIYRDGRINYGNVYNKLYVLAALFGARRLHRRDSDTYAQAVVRGSESECVFPVDLELEWLGKVTEHGKILLVGGGYRGKWSIDIDHLIEDPDTRDLRRFFSALSIAEDEHEVVLQEHIRGNSEPYESDVLEFMSVKEPDCGNMALADIFEYVPCSPVPYSLGSDYFTLACVIEGNFARLYHNRATVHAHTACRYDNRGKLFNYWRATACLVVYQHFHRAYWRHLKREGFRSGIAARPLDELTQFVAGTLRTFREEYAARSNDVGARLADFYAVIEKKGEPALSEALARVRANQGDLIEMIMQSIGHHIELVEVWKLVMDAARRAANEHDVRRLIVGSRL